MNYIIQNVNRGVYEKKLLYFMMFIFSFFFFKGVIVAVTFNEAPTDFSFTTNNECATGATSGQICQVKVSFGGSYKSLRVWGADSNYYFYPYMRVGSNNKGSSYVYCIKKGSTGPNAKSCNSSITNYEGNGNDKTNKIRAAVGYVIANSNLNYGKKQYVIQRLLSKLQSQSKISYGGTEITNSDKYNTYETYVDAAITQYNNYPSVPGTYYLANFYNCGSGIQPIADGYTEVKIDPKYYLDVNVMVDGVNTNRPGDYVKYNMSINNTSVGSGISDYWTQHSSGTQYSLTSLQVTDDNYVFDGIYEDNNSDSVSYETSKSGTMGDAARTIWIKLKSKGELIIEKINTSDLHVLNAEIKFNIYKGNSCDTNVYDTFDCKTGGSGKCNYSLAEGIYSVKEVEIKKQGPNNMYAVSNECVNVGTISSGQNTTIKYINKTQCEIDFEKDSSISNRLKLYEKYKFRNLLNFEDKTTASEACSVYVPDYDPQNECLSTDQVNNVIKNKFTNKNLSDYNDTITAYPDSISYCLTDFELTKGPNVNYNQGIRVKAGRMIFNIDKEDVVAEGTLTKTCYIHKDNYNNYELSKDNYILLGEYVDKVTLDGVELRKKFNKSIPTSTLIGDFYKVEGTAEITYKPNPIYAEKITGKQSDNCLDANGNVKDACRLLGYGVASKFKDANEINSGFNFSITGPLTSIFNFGTGSTCEYRVDPEVIGYDNPEDKGNLELEFRTIDTTNPFNRNTKSNWSNGTDSTKNNQTVKDNIINKNNSYNKTGTGSLYTNQPNGTKRIILTPDLVQSIREYNASHPYNDYTVYTEEVDGETKTSTSFFDYIGLTKVQ